EYRAGIGLHQQRVDALGADAPGVVGDLLRCDGPQPGFVGGVGLELGQGGLGGEGGGGGQQCAGEGGGDGETEDGHGEIGEGGRASVVDRPPRGQRGAA